MSSQGRGRPHDLLSLNSNMMMPRRPDTYHSLPASPLAMNHRSFPQMDMSMAQHHGLVDDYFGSGHQQLVSRPRSPFMTMHDRDMMNGEGNHVSQLYGYGIEGDNGSARSSHQICEVNARSTLANGQVPGGLRYANIWPHVCDDGRYPKDFCTPKTVETMKIFDSTYRVLALRTKLQLYIQY